MSEGHFCLVPDGIYHGCEQVLLSGGTVAVLRDVQDWYSELCPYHEVLICLMEFDLIALRSLCSCSPKLNSAGENSSQVKDVQFL